MARDIKTRDFEKMLKDNGYTYDHQKGSHRVWIKNGCDSIVTTCHAMNTMVVKRLIKEHNL